MGRLWDDPSAFVMRAMDIIDQNGFNATAHAQSWDRMTSEEQRQHAEWVKDHSRNVVSMAIGYVAAGRLPGTTPSPCTSVSCMAPNVPHTADNLADAVIHNTENALIAGAALYRDYPGVTATVNAALRSCSINSSAEAAPTARPTTPTPAVVSRAAPSGTANSTNRSTPLSAPAGASPPASPGSIIFQDDFSNPNSGWPNGTASSGARYLDHEYAINSKWATLPNQRLANVLVEVDARIMPPTEHSHLILNLLLTSNFPPSLPPGANWYEFTFDPNNGQIALNRRWWDFSSGSSTALIEPTIVAFFHPDSEWNRFGFRAVGSHIVLFMNGREVGQVTDDAISEGVIQLGVGGDNPSEARFRNFVVTAADENTRPALPSNEAPEMDGER